MQQSDDSPVDYGSNQEAWPRESSFAYLGIPLCSEQQSLSPA